MCTGVFQKASILFFTCQRNGGGFPRSRAAAGHGGHSRKQCPMGLRIPSAFTVRTRTPDVSPGWRWCWRGLAGFKSRRSISARMLSSMTLFSQNALPRFAPICVCLFPSNRRSSCCCFRLVGRVGLVSCPPVKGLQTAPSSSLLSHVLVTTKTPTGAFVEASLQVAEIRQPRYFPRFPVTLEENLPPRNAHHTPGADVDAPMLLSAACGSLFVPAASRKHRQNHQVA